MDGAAPAPENIEELCRILDADLLVLILRCLDLSEVCLIRRSCHQLLQLPLAEYLPVVLRLNNNKGLVYSHVYLGSK